MANLVIVESPAKANTIKGYLGSNYKVIASKGHVRDLPKSTLGIDVDNGFEPHYINIRGKGDVIKELKKEAKSASKIFLATDPDREGEAISWHIANQLGIPEDKACRITFNEITKTAVRDAIKSPRKINIDLVNSQQARRILDRLIGFNLSQVLWKNLKSGLSGGRVQSVAMRIVTEREEEIRAFKPQEYWTIEAILKNGNDNLVVRFYGNKRGKKKIENGEMAATIEQKISGSSFKVISVKHTEKQKTPAPPFTTSTLQQEASRRLGFQAQRIMKVAQELYDGLNLGSELGGVQGLITYMRTDSQRIAPSAQEAALEYIKNNYGDEFLPRTARVYKSNANSQDAHEAIRPSNVNLTPKLVKKSLTSEQYKIYKLIWERFVASQMENAVFDTVSVDVENSGYIFKTGGYVIKSKGFLAVYGDGNIETDSDEITFDGLPDVKNNQELECTKIVKEQHFTEPPARYTEASLIKFLEENGIGRPSTYAPIISIIVSRNYVRRDGKSLVATELGEITTKFIQEHFPEIIDYDYTSLMESNLDSIENKENTIVGVISDFYKKFEEELAIASKNESKVNLVPEVEESNVICDKCGATMVYKTGRFGRFLACPGYPSCRNTKAVDKEGNVVEAVPLKVESAGFNCEKCGAEMIVRRGKFGNFYACSKYPTCTFTKQKNIDIGAHCPKCDSKILARHGRGKTLFYSCERYPECDFSSWDMPLVEKCPNCNEMLFYRKSKKTVMCKNKSCGYKREEEMTVIE